MAKRYDEARAEADAADARITAALQRAATGDAAAMASLPPYLGVPCTIKECFALAGMPQSSGLVARRGVVAGEDATTVARLRAAGAIPLGVTNVSELCMWIETNNRVYGRTNNPYDPSRIVGGSSGGEGAIIGAGGSPFGLGSDVGGSIRMPAFFNGVFGHKPTGGAGARHRANIRARTAKRARIVATGPLCRRAEDLWPLVRDHRRPRRRSTKARCRRRSAIRPTVRIDALTIVDVEDNGMNPVSARAQRGAGARGRRRSRVRGARIRRVRFPSLRRSFEIWSATLAAADTQSFSVLLGNGRRTRGALELAKWALRRSPHTLPAIGLAMLERVNDWPRGRAPRAIEMGRALRREIVDALGDDGVMLYPSYVSPAPRHYKPLLGPFNFVYTAIINVMQLPATQVPLGLGAEGLPLGVQVVAPPARDHLSVAVAQLLEREFGGWVPPA